MAQQPNIEVDPADRPRSTPQPAPARLGRDDRPGVITTPGAMPSGPGFGTPGPDAGWGLRLIRQLQPGLDPDLEAVFAALMTARAARLGRAPIAEDLEVAMILNGLGDDLPDHLVERSNRWVTAVPHESSKGRTAVAEIDRTLLDLKPAALRDALR